MTDEDHIFREVEDDLRRERYERLWKKYGPFVIATIVIVLLSMIGWQQWQHYQDRQRAKEAEAFLAATQLLAEKKEAAAADAFAKLAAKAGPGYRAVARLQEAEAWLEQDNSEHALKAYDALAADDEVDPKLRALAALKGALLLADSASPEQLKKRLRAPLRPNSPWRFNAEELVAYGYYRTHQYSEARTAYQNIVNEFAAPSALRQRARNMLTLIGSEEAQGAGAKPKAGGAKGKTGEPKAPAPGLQNGKAAKDTKKAPPTNEAEGDKDSKSGASSKDDSAKNSASSDKTAAENGGKH